MSKTNRTAGSCILGRVASVMAMWSLCFVSGGCGSPSADNDEPPRLIAHAGGIGEQRTDTNSLEALDASVARGHTVIEVDLSWTTDGHLVLLHDWDDTLTGLFDREPGSMTEAGFLSLTSPHGLTHLSLDDLVEWLERHPGVLVVTDLKARNLDGLRMIAESYPAVRYRFVPQIFFPESLVEVRQLGFERVIFSLYRSQLSDRDIVEFVIGKRPWAVTMPARWTVRRSLLADLAESGVPIFAHTINDYTMVDRLHDAGLYGVYTDWLSPADRDLSGPLPEWSVTTSGEFPMNRWLVPFLSWGMDGMEVSMGLRSSGESEVDARVSVRGSGGNILALQTVLVSGRDFLVFDPTATVPSDRGHGWIEVEAGTELDAELRWSFRHRSRGTRPLAGVAVERFETHGPGLGVGGMLVAIVNPTQTAQTYRLFRSISERVIDDETIEVQPQTQLVRVYRSWTDSDISVSVSGGPMVVQTLRWDPLGQFMR